MFKRNLLITILSLFMVLNAFSQGEVKKARHYLEKRGEVVLSVPLQTKKDIVKLSNLLYVDAVRGDSLIAYANTRQFESFLGKGYSFHVMPPYSEGFHAEMCKSVEDLRDWDTYPSYETYEAMMYSFAEDYPDICKLVEIGELNSGRKLLAVKISDNVNEDESEPEFFYTGQMHGDELVGFMLLLRLSDYLLSNYGEDSRITSMVDNMEIWINPLANPDGTYAGGNASVNGATRTNANNVDFNRNFPDPEDGPHPDGNPWQPETIAFMDFAEGHHFVMSANLHSGAELLNYPWDTWQKRHADNDWWIYVCYEYADTVHQYSNGYLYGEGDGVTNGYDWYTISGGRQDYMTYFQQCRECTMELSNTKMLPESELDMHWEYNYRSLLNYMEQARYGIGGIITDSISNEPIKAMISISGHDQDSSMVFSSSQLGDYHRLLNEGIYDISFSAEGYFPKSIHDVQILNRTLLHHDIALIPGDLIADFYASEQEIPSGTSVQFFDDSYGEVAEWNWYFEGGQPEYSNEQNPLVSYNTEGNFDVQLSISDGSSENTMLRMDYISVNLEYTMQNASINTCGGIFMDSGGNNAAYQDDEDYIMTFTPGEEGAKISMDFLEFNVEYDDQCDYDWLKIYDGADITAPLIGTYCGTSSPGIITSSSEEGSLTFSFHSDYSYTAPGWKASISCEGNVGLYQQEDSFCHLSYSASEKVVLFEGQGHEMVEAMLRIYNINGMEIASLPVKDPNGTHKFDVSFLERGVFIVSMTALNGEQQSLKLVVF